MKVYPITVDYSMTFEEMLAAGKYDKTYQVGEDDVGCLAPKFDIKGQGVVSLQAVLVNIRHATTYCHIPRLLHSRGLERAKLEHLLAFGAAYPELQRKYCIEANGSNLTPFVGWLFTCPILKGNKDERIFDVRGIDIIDTPGCGGSPSYGNRILAIMK